MSPAAKGDETGWSERLRAGFRKLSAPSEELYAADLNRDVRSRRRFQRTPIADLDVRSYATILGRLTLVVFETGGQQLRVSAEISDGSATATLIWLGRGRIPGLEAGARLRVAGRVADRDGLFTFYNPYYELVR
ncbi:OB-fold nucleic acid binding domain-containing protein [Haloglycomyces albus]|uniref:OB-fold nucleic acid binding domain-containing protein n=1 Tax=Haloglycomyces albus TaxID=526067 RepID=UPI00046CAFD3|nr:OB-fold nucleic acid binding domain-containing protein [Haloglycomyces albus]